MPARISNKVERKVAVFTQNTQIQHNLFSEELTTKVDLHYQAIALKTPAILSAMIS